ncbi:hypothetical protein HHX47_DHR1001557 [Lentinula edodes]|nr:hypothetical protein HHX47_DHR1001557 [Lentinula edodes]
MSSRPTKRSRTGDIPPFGAPSDLETAIFQVNEPSSRTLPLTTVPTLVTFCDWRFVSCFKRLREHNSLWESRISHQLQLLPDSVLPRLFTLLKKSHPGFLPHEIIVTTDATFMAQLHPYLIEQQVSMPKLQTLKLRGLQLADSSIDFLVSLSPNLRRLDISFTATKRPILFTSRRDVFSVCAHLSAPPLEKLSLTSTPVAISELLQTIASFSNLQTLSLGALGAAGSMGVASATTLNDATLPKLTSALQSFPNLRSVNLVSNTRLSKASLFSFIQRVGRKCLPYVISKYLNLAGITTMRSDALAALLPMDGTHPALETLVLNNTSIGDDSGAYIACCCDLVRLEVEGTKFTSEGLFPIIDACSKLQVLNLTSCRGVRIADRRRFFEVQFTLPSF